MADFSLNGLSALLKGRLGPEKYSRQIESALALAFRGHDGQSREQADPQAPSIPYIVHPVGVALLAAELLPHVDVPDEFDDVIAACLSHDLLEDTDISPYELERATSQRTMELVIALSKPSSARFSSREERNAALINSIKNAGRTAVFIKICDSLHNLSRPELTPRKLLAKTAQKARRQYAHLIETQGLGETLLARYRSKLDEVDELLAQMRGGSLLNNRFNDLASVFSYCRQRTKRKVLEPHDIVDILAEVTGAHEVIYTSVDCSLGDLLGITNNDRDDALPLPELLKAKGGDISLDALSETIRTRIAPATRIVVATPKAFGRGKRSFLALLSPKAPTWVSEPALSIIVTYLLERALLREAGHVTEMADLLAAYGVNLDPRLAIEAGLVVAHIADLAKRFEAAAGVRGYLDAILLDRLPPNLKVRIERHEARTKAAESIVRKMILRNMTVEEVEDLIGYRFVVRNLADKPKVTRYLTERIQRSGLTNGVKPIVKSIQTGAGYSAEHILCSIQIGRLFDGTLPVEIQIRTVLEDAWARVSQTIDYKKKNVVIKRNEKLLRRLRDVISEIEKEL